MATLDWPTDRCFQPAPDSEFGLRAPASSFTGFFTASYQSLAHASDRWHANLILPPCPAADGQKREAFFNRLLTGDDVRLGHVLRRSSSPSGTLRGSPVLAATAPSGSRALSLSGGTAYNNRLLASSEFERTEWNKGPGGSISSDSIVSPEGEAGLEATADQYTAGTTSTFAWLSQVISENAALDWTFSCYMKSPSKTSISLAISDVTTSTLSGARTLTSAWQRLSFSVAAAALSNTTYVGVGFLGVTPGDIFDVWGAQLERGSAPSRYARLITLSGGDMLSCGGQLLQVASDVLLADTGATSVPLNNAIRVSQSSGASVVWSAPTARMCIPLNSLLHRAGRSSWHRALEIPLVEVA